MKRVICFILGHNWYTDVDEYKRRHIVFVCGRCWKEEYQGEDE